MNEHQILMLTIAHEAIVEDLIGYTPFTYMLIKQDPPAELQKSSGVFVTVQQEQSHRLRGCIGSTGEGSVPLYESIYTMAKKAAFQDPRFRPLKVDELKHLTLSVSILSQIREIEDVNTIRLGTDGVIYQYEGRSALFLPEVAVEQNWTLERMLGQLCLKASLPPTFYASGRGTYFTFTTTRVSGRIGG
ncbi:MAG: AmmeMemoRadiSam system protein A [Sphaerochaetaceae bacterium]|nr:AmmeMemoRadiSam system protein A [Sphaerochaetaceae bacterium]